MISQAQSTEDRPNRKLLIINENGSQFLVGSYVTIDMILQDPLMKDSLDLVGRVEIEIVPVRELGEALTALDIPVTSRRGNDE